MDSGELRAVGTGSSPQARESWAETYRNTPYQQLPWFSATPADWIVRSYRERWLRRGGTHLEVGCGAGTNALWIARRDVRTVGIDLAEGAVRAARSRARHRPVGARPTFVQADALALPFADGAFRSASDIGCFHTLPPSRRRDYGEELYRVLVPGGHLIMSWVAREETRAMGPPHRPSVEEVAGALEKRFLLLRVEYRGGPWRSKTYSGLLRRRDAPQPPPR